MTPKISFVRLIRIDPAEILAHMSDPRVAEHMPLVRFRWDAAAVARFIAAKEDCWHRDGLGHWSIVSNDAYAGWGGFQKEGDGWDFGLVLRPGCFGLGPHIVKTSIAFAVADKRIPFVTFLLPPSRPHLRALERLGARFLNRFEHDGETFLKYRIETD